MPPKPKMKACKAKVKDNTGATLDCPGIIVNEEGRDLLCTNKANHIGKLKTGYCNDGWHEGEKKLSYAGNPVRSCLLWRVCPCECHAVYDRMFSEMGMERLVQDNSGYHVERTFVMPERTIVTPVDVLSDNGGTDTQPRYESPAPGLVPAAMARTFAPTASGRAARGELEHDVKRAIDIFIIEQEEGFCTPTWISEEIAKSKGILPPSTGAVSAVLDRWVAYGFAETAKKPSRFVRYTDAGLELGLEVMKDKYKRKTRMETTAQRLGRSR